MGVIPLAELSPKFKEKVIRIFGQSGEDWIARIPLSLEQCMEKWKLHNLEPIANDSINLLYYTYAAEFGQVVLKLTPPTPAYRTEIDALWRLNPDYVCRCYDTQAESHAMLLEEIIPGHNLAVPLKDEERIQIVGQLVQYLPKPMEPSPFFPHLDNQVVDTFKRLRNPEAKTDRKINPVEPPPSELLALAERAEILYFEDLYQDGNSTFLLHGDLHHFNILKSNFGPPWRAIDPKGVVGIKAMESARFIRNELMGTLRAKRKEKLGWMCERFSQYLEASPVVIATCAFVDTVLGAAWQWEDRERSRVIMRTLRLAEEIQEFLPGPFSAP